METSAAAEFLNVPALIESSRPQRRAAWFWYAAVAAGLLVFSAVAGQKSPQARQVSQIFSTLIIFGVGGLLGTLWISAARELRAAQQGVDDVAELVQLRHWQPAAFLLEQILSRPAATMQLRAQALVYLSMVLSRYQRFEDAIAVHEHLLDEGLVDASTAVGLRLGRAMAMLREDHLFDADRAINELRRIPGASESAAVALVEIYRDVKTGHPEDAIRTFEEKLPLLRDQLGVRSADAFALAARAYQLREQPARAADAWRRATLLAPAAELVRRYPELHKAEQTLAGESWQIAEAEAPL